MTLNEIKPIDLPQAQRWPFIRLNKLKESIAKQLLRNSFTLGLTRDDKIQVKTTIDLIERLQAELVTAANIKQPTANTARPND